MPSLTSSFIVATSAVLAASSADAFMISDTSSGALSPAAASLASCVHTSSVHNGKHSYCSSVALRAAGDGFGALKEPPVPTITEREEALADYNEAQKSKISPELQQLSPETIRDSLIDLLPRMTGTAEEFKQVENYINALEAKYEQVQTLGFLNLAMGGEWQLLFSTNRLGVPSPQLRLREMVQTIAPDNLDGSVTNIARWDLSEHGNGIFESSGTFSVKCGYNINQGARMNVDLQDHVIELSRGSAVPSNVEGLVGMLAKAMPSELFDPNELAMDTTFLDGTVRIVRMTGGRFEGVRNVFVRKGSVEVDPNDGGKAI